MPQTPLPIDPHVEEIVAHVRSAQSAVIVAPPGAGKTTRVPPALAALGRTILLQPRRVAARALTRRIALERGWRVGEEIGWQIRFERRFSSRTRLLVATEGILTARMQSHPPLHGSLDVDAQERALAPLARRKVILATNIAETSLTVEGVTSVIDSGLQKLLRFDPETAVDHLVTERISRDSADQRGGRAGRTGAGRVTRLWDERDILRPHREPEIRRVDLAPVVLDIVAWGGDPRT